MCAIMTVLLLPPSESCRPPQPDAFEDQERVRTPGGWCPTFSRRVSLLSL